MIKGVRIKPSLKPKRIKRIFSRKTQKLRATGSLKRLAGIRKRRRKGDLTLLKEELWELCKQITRKRYINAQGTWTCYTSGTRILLPKNCHTGHFIPSSLCSVELRYDLKNLRPQSYNDNINHSGNPHQYRRNLIRDHGETYITELETRNEATKGLIYKKEWFEMKIKEYTELLNSLSPEPQHQTEV